MKSLTSLLLFASLILAPLAHADDVSVVKLKVSGMTCATCASAVREALLKIGGVNAAEVDLDKALAVVRFDATRTSPPNLIAAVAVAGGKRHVFTATVAPPEKADATPTTPVRRPSCCAL